MAWQKEKNDTRLTIQLEARVSDVLQIVILKKSEREDSDLVAETRRKSHRLPHFRAAGIRLVKQDTNAVHARRLIVQRYIGGIIQSIGSIICIRA